MSKINKIMIGLSAGLLTAAIFLTSAKPSEFDAGTDIFRVVVSDTITDTEADTIALSPNLFSFWKYNHVIEGDQLTGTIVLYIKVQERNAPNSSIWYEIESDSITSDLGVKQLYGDNYGINQRIIITGSGTQSSKYTIQSVLKKPY
jgi:hypothetical protein